jgi:dTDP-4-amino-4,6-dideoxygalactose transaminase
LKVPFLDLKAQYRVIKEEVESGLQEVMANTAFVSGPFVQKFEQEFSKFCGPNYCIAVNSGTSALHVALLAHGIQPGNEIITVPNTFIATIWAITYCGAKPVFVDVDQDTWLINPDLIEQAITPKTKAIIPVHLYGQPVDMDPINEIAKKHNLVVIEDAAQAHAATYNGKRIGSLGNTTCFSFYPGKNLGAYGEGGAVVTDNAEIANHIRMLRDHGQPKKYYHDYVGYNYRMDGFQGAVLSAKLKYLQEWTDRRNDIARCYSDGLGGIDGLKVPHVRDNAISAFHLYVIHTEKRDELMKYLNEQGIAAGLHYPIPIHLQKAYKHLNYKKGDFSVTERNANQCLSLPLYPEITDKQIRFVVSYIEKYFSNNDKKFL